MPIVRKVKKPDKLYMSGAYGALARVLEVMRWIRIGGHYVETRGTEKTGSFWDGYKMALHITQGYIDGTYSSHNDHPLMQEAKSIADGKEGRDE